MKAKSKLVICRRNNAWSGDIPQSAQQMLAYIGLMNEALPGVLTGVYLHGSVALGA